MDAQDDVQGATAPPDLHCRAEQGSPRRGAPSLYDLLAGESLDVRDFLQPADERSACRFLLWLPRHLWRVVMGRGSIAGTKNPSAVLEKRMIAANGGQPLVPPVDVYIANNDLAQHEEAVEYLKDLEVRDPAMLRHVLRHGSVGKASAPMSVLQYREERFRQTQDFAAAQQPGQHPHAHHASAQAPTVAQPQMPPAADPHLAPHPPVQLQPQISAPPAQPGHATTMQGAEQHRGGLAMQQTRPPPAALTPSQPIMGADGDDVLDVFEDLRAMREVQLQIRARQAEAKRTEGEASNEAWQARQRGIVNERLRVSHAAAVGGGGVGAAGLPHAVVNDAAAARGTKVEPTVKTEAPVARRSAAAASADDRPAGWKDRIEPDLHGASGTLIQALLKSRPRGVPGHAPPPAATVRAEQAPAPAAAAHVKQEPLLEVKREKRDRFEGGESSESAHGAYMPRPKRPKLV